MKILVVEDNKNLRENIIFLLKKNNYLAEWAQNWEEAFEKISFSDYETIILDINMPILNWKDFLKKFREKWKNTPVIALTSNSMLTDKLELFDLWVDDYLTKPFEIEELLARIKSLLKRASHKIENKKIIWDLKINFDSKKIFFEEKEIIFTYKQYLIIEFLSKNQNFPQTKQKILEYVWWENEENLEFDSTTLESHIYSIRKKLWKNIIKTIKWIWYVIE